MNKDQALSVVEQALDISAQKGVFGLQDSATVLMALNILKQEFQTQSEQNIELTEIKKEGE